MPDKRLQSKMAFRSGYFHGGRKAEYKLDLPPAQRELTGEVAEYRPHFGPMCAECGSRPICNGCARCRKCPNA